MKKTILTLALLCAAAPAVAQETPADIISFLVTNQFVPTGDFPKDQAAAAATRDTIARAVLVNLATAPIATSSSGFVYHLDSNLGTMTRVSDSFGTFFVERAMTSGRGRVSFGASATMASFDRLDGFNLRDGSLLTTANQFRDEAAPFDTEALTMRIRFSTMTMYGSYGLTDRLEIGGALPLAELHIDGTRVNVYRGQTFVQASGTASASGVGDAAIRAKYVVAGMPGAAFAVAGEVRLPTGNDALLLGAGRAALRVTAIGSVEHDRLGVHGNAAVVRGGASNELDASGAVTVAATPRLTITGEMLVRHLSDLREIVPVEAPHPTIAGVDTLRLLPGDAVPTVSSVVTGVKWNAHTRIVITGQVVWRMGTAGLTAPFTPLVGVDYLF